MNIKYALGERLAQHPILEAESNGVFRRTSPPDTPTPFIVYRVWGYENKRWDFQGKKWYKPWEVYIDFVGKPEQEDKIDTLANIVEAELGGFSGNLNEHRTGKIKLKKRETWEDQATWYVVVRLVFSFQETYSHQ